MSSTQLPSSAGPGFHRAPPVRLGDEVAGKYRVDQVLGSGGMGVVVRAWHLDLEQDVAIKFLHPELAARSDAAERFRREARSVVRIRSDHVVRVLDVGTLEAMGVPYIVMEYLRGRDLARELAERKRVPVEDAARYVFEACDAVGEAHAQDIVHRDLKPANLFLAERRVGGQIIKVLDFGISKTIGAGRPVGVSLTEPATLVGSPAYMSPEQLESSPDLDGRTDIWSLGVILQEMVTGALPFDGDSVPQLIRAVLAGKRAPLGESEGLARLEPVVASCLQQERARRFQSVAELRDALSPFVPAHPSARGRDTIGAPGEKVGANPPAAEEGGAEKKDGAEADGAGLVSGSAWGRTQGARRGSLWRTLALPALMGAAVALGFWLGRRALRDWFSRAGDERPVTEEIRKLQPRPPPSSAAPRPSNEAESGAAAPRLAASGPAPAPDPPSAPPTITKAPAATPPPLPRAAPKSTPPAGTATGAPAPSDESQASPPPPAAKRTRNLYEIPGLGGRE